MIKQFPFYRRFDAKDCGPACLRMITKHYGKSYSQHTMHEKCNITREGEGIALTLEPTPQFYEEEGEKDKKIKIRLSI